jgi:hypothetical protein
MKIRPVGAVLIHAETDGRTDVTKLIDAFSDLRERAYLFRFRYL